MFMFKKIVTHFLLPPGAFIVVLLLSGAWFLAKRNRKAGLVNIALGMAIWIFSIAPVSNALMRGLEADQQLPANPRGDVIILLGGGIYGEVNDLSGTGAPSGDMLARIVTAVRLQKNLNIPIIVSSGSVFSWEPSEARIDRRFLVDLGVPNDKIILEEKSRDTIENARYSKEICEKNRYKKPLLVTSAFHMKRAVLSFKKFDVEVTPYPANLNIGKKETLTWRDYLPGDPGFATLALREYLGLLFYAVVY